MAERATHIGSITILNESERTLLEAACEQTGAVVVGWLTKNIAQVATVTKKHFENTADLYLEFAEL